MDLRAIQGAFALNQRARAVHEVAFPAEAPAGMHEFAFYNNVQRLPAKDLLVNCVVLLPAVAPGGPNPVDAEGYVPGGPLLPVVPVGGVGLTFAAIAQSPSFLAIFVRSVQPAAVNADRRINLELIGYAGVDPDPLFQQGVEYRAGDQFSLVVPKTMCWLCATQAFIHQSVQPLIDANNAALVLAAQQAAANHIVAPVPLQPPQGAPLPGAALPVVQPAAVHQIVNIEHVASQAAMEQHLNAMRIRPLFQSVMAFEELLYPHLQPLPQPLANNPMDCDAAAYDQLMANRYTAKQLLTKEGIRDAVNNAFKDALSPFRAAAARPDGSLVSLAQAPAYAMAITFTWNADPTNFQSATLATCPDGSIDLQRFFTAYRTFIAGFYGPGSVLVSVFSQFREEFESLVSVYRTRLSPRDFCLIIDVVFSRMSTALRTYNAFPVHQRPLFRQHLLLEVFTIDTNDPFFQDFVHDKTVARNEARLAVLEQRFAGQAASAAAAAAAALGKRKPEHDDTAGKPRKERGGRQDKTRPLPPDLVRPPLKEPICHNWLMRRSACMNINGDHTVCKLHNGKHRNHRFHAEDTPEMRRAYREWVHAIEAHYAQTKQQAIA
jgi:hypothetical protein